ncbi:MAG: hypothetical protein ACREFZ_03310 [Acetobacteraceae bacterium]
MTFKLRAFFPTESARPEESMLEVSVTDYFEKAAPDSYVPVISYVARRYGDAKLGRLDLVRARLLFPGTSEAAERFFDAAYPGGTVPSPEKVGPRTSEAEGTVSFPVESKDGWHLASGVLQFTNVDRQQLAAILVPLLVPGP